MRYLVHHLLESSARAHPQRTAVIDRERTLSYLDLDSRSNRLAAHLRDQGVIPGDRVGVYLEKSLESVIAVYGIMKAGAAYVPLDPDAPVMRLAQIASNCGIRYLVTGSEKRDQWGPMIEAGAPIEKIGVLNAEGLDGVQLPVSMFDRSAIDSETDGRVANATVDQDLAYILYTSGSTGVPKGVMLSHRNALAFVTWAAEEFKIGPNDRLSSHAPLHFDLSVFDLYAAAYAGAAVVLVPPKASLFPSEIVRFVRDNQITVWYSVPSILSMVTLRGGLAKNRVSSLKTVLFAGEVFPTKYLRELMCLIPNARFANLYGPTETNVCTWYEVTRLDDGQNDPVPIGAPIDNDAAFALKEDGARAEVGETGELLVRGATVMRGYWGDPERTREVLIEDPLGQEPKDPVYRTGDIVEVLTGGSFRYIGRRDTQVKSRGYRIELGDIEAVLVGHPDVVECAVVAVPDGLVTNRIVAYVNATSGATEVELARFCAERLPHYMVPETFQLLDGLPKTSTGKVDRRGLLELSTS